ncbi:TPA: IS1 family transposase [Candidatus Woesearchaeota archaeon]|nr:IS1 family transposase [Candidatus Woesearchaeota archaeon]HIH31659.1 IS1 family transposase [Candidatus Woesearchaeota archaeon]HIH54821.1 IS1 family transposase [Candidatus Woesearchaeota archaeon]HIJ02135.1 IS1 family transposase [Candidatus Woesearchaeota archaeon]HIJ13658.1 IS1 family transposase [Candidatus Woesearchaeota archaeon]
MCYGQKVKSKNGVKIIPAIKRKIFGNPNIDDINTNTSESFNSILRENVSRLVRKTKCHAKEKFALNNALALFQFYWNFMHELEKRLTPAIIEKQTTKVWTWGNFLHAKLTFV